ncbi:MAG: glucosamine-6-phosphate synthase, partial [Actinobacteria bacterium]|nr:glucosamine-6-phosphate synthase [Actinomycetota bacterium]
MCGIIGVVSRPSGRAVPTSAEVLAGLDDAIRTSRDGDVALTANHVGRVDLLLRGDAGLEVLMDNRRLALDITSRLDELDAFAQRSEAELEAASSLSVAEVERRSLDLARLKDANWAIRNDRLRNAVAVFDLAGTGATDSARNAYFSIQQAFAALDRMEVRGRDSAGVHVMVWGHGLEATDSRVAPLLVGRQDDALFTSRSVRVGAPGCAWSFVYKAAAEIGELGDNTRAMRSAVVADDLLRLLVSQHGARVSVLGHTRWASVGIISEPNAHPVNSEELESTFGTPYLVAALNGDVDNHADIKVRNGLRIADPITTDAKVIPTVVARRRASGESLGEAFRNTVREFDGSVAIATASAESASTMLLALRGSGQGLCVGLAEDRYIVASEPYGLVEETIRYVRMDGEALADVNNPATRGQVVVLDGELAGTLDGCSMMAYDGSVIALDEASVTV